MLFLSIATWDLDLVFDECCRDERARDSVCVPVEPLPSRNEDEDVEIRRGGGGGGGGGEEGSARMGTGILFGSGMRGTFHSTDELVCRGSSSRSSSEYVGARHTKPPATGYAAWKFPNPNA